MTEAAAWSVDGRTFEFKASIDAPISLGAFVVVGDAPERFIGQVLQREGAGEGAVDGVRGAGTLLPAKDGFASPRGDVGFAARAIRPATSDEVAASGILALGDGALEIGTLRVGEDLAPAELKASGFTRHTFLCGQSGSGKTYATGTILERLVAETSLRMVVFDPNGDYAAITAPRDGADPERAARLAAAAPKVRHHSADAPSGAPHIRLTDLSPAAQMALLRLDPAADRTEVATFLDVLARRAAGEDPRVLIEQLGDSNNTEPLAVRCRALGLTSWTTWALDEPSVVDGLGDPDGVHVIDVSGVDVPQQMYAIAAAVLDHLWERRDERIPTLIAIDEAHNLCTADPTDALQAHVTDRLVQIAGEGRKFGLHLLVATQRPAKLHVNVMSQCDNLVLLRMNSLGDLTEIRELFGAAPPGLVDRSVSFSQGEALVSGPISPIPQLVRFGGRISREGGTDIPVDWTHPRA